MGETVRTMTNIYFVRHAEPNFNNHDDETRELSEKGMADRKLVTDFLTDKKIDAVLSSPFKRAVDTVKDFADIYGYEISIMNDFRERKVDSGWIENFYEFSKKQWEDFEQIRPLMPWIVHFVFQGEVCVGMEGYDVFTGETHIYL